MRLTRKTPSTSYPRRAVRASATLLLAAGLVVMSAGAIGASADGCGDYSFGFTGTRLINDGISDSAGPFEIALPAGTYDITMWANDDHPSPTYQVEQLNESWYFVLDNGYQSPPTDDIGADRTSVITNVGGVDLAAATTISVHHVKIGGVNSVNVECVGFTPSIDVAAPATTSEVPKAVGPVTTSTVPTASPATTAQPTEPLAQVTTTTISTEVKQTVEVPEAQLAITGLGSGSLIIIGAIFITAGFACLVLQRRTMLGL
ncbi:MAG: hypothetical protein ACI81L_003321 [Verrucomicrobiales bacterium]|jgi:hypothetical protein